MKAALIVISIALVVIVINFGSSLLFTNRTLMEAMSQDALH
jgi:hypothetical protein